MESTVRIDIEGKLYDKVEADNREEAFKKAEAKFHDEGYDISKMEITKLEAQIVT
jgi:hypothetical protein